ncbi:nuclear transport factor 2 family protein [Gordonia insulae]|uniref:SnoaL-like domain-containing protein n=1 Tax=Gordonia insulae TaxID=2420509 RepID=A0A3G8JSW3_9ACTN|nr:nuclear transport factor 2 family protein [Gordonia insulae]AZG47996.1 hypothetical protein D7316_04608 [Gordonia insulae]
MTITDHHAALTELVARSAISDRMSAYLDSCDVSKDADEIAGHFTFDGIWEGVGRNVEFGRAQGTAAIAALFADVPQRQPFTVHYLTNPRIEIDGNVAVGRWLCFEPSTIRQGTMPVWIGLRYEVDFREVQNSWLIAHLRCDTLFATPYDIGWGKEMFTAVTATEPRTSTPDPVGHQSPFTPSED